MAKTDDISDGRKGCVLTQRFNDAFVDIFKRRADERRKDDEESLAEYKSEDGRVRFELAVFDVKRGMRELKKKGYYLFHDDTDHPSFKNDNGEILIPDDVDERSKLGELYTLASEIIKNDGECMTL
ncbi:MAG: hypothetical protein LBT92_03460 [Rickettsiales bacterium]|nr:hypothetical protein [Rickettsiales bacterium]